MSKKLLVKNKYTVIPNSIVMDNRISSKALGMFCYIQNKPDDWEFSAKNIAHHKKEGIDLVRSALVELETYGYLHRIKSQDEKGFWSIDYILSDKPCVDNPTQDNPTKENPLSGNPTNNSKKKRSKPITSKEELNIPFDDFYNAYGKKVDREGAEKKWRSLTDNERELALKDAPVYSAMNPEKKYQKSPLVYLNGKNWKDERVNTPSIFNSEDPIEIEKQARRVNFEQRINGMPYLRNQPMDFHDKISVYHVKLGRYDQRK